MEALSFEGKKHQQVDIGIGARLALGIGPEQNNFVRLKLPGDLFAQFLDPVFIHHGCSPLRFYYAFLAR